MPLEKKAVSAPPKPDKTFVLYKGSVTIDFYEKFGRYLHFYKIRETGVNPISVTGATGMIDKSVPLGIWQERLSVEALTDGLKERIKAIKKHFKSSKGMDLEQVMGVIFSEEFIKAACHTYKVKKEEGASTGDAVHKWIEQFIEHRISGVGDPEMPKDNLVLNGVTAFLNWVEKFKVKFLASEQIVYSKKYGYVGKMDVIVEYKLPDYGKVISIGDFKTNNWKQDYDPKTGKPVGESYSVIYDEQRYQVAGYRGAFEEEKGEYFTGPRLIFAFDKLTGRFHVHNLEITQDAFKKDFVAFLNSLGLRKREKEIKETMRELNKPKVNYKDKSGKKLVEA